MRKKEYVVKELTALPKEYKDFLNTLETKKYCQNSKDFNYLFLFTGPFIYDKLFYSFKEFILKNNEKFIISSIKGNQNLEISNISDLSFLDLKAKIHKYQKFYEEGFIIGEKLDWFVYSLGTHDICIFGGKGKKFKDLKSKIENLQSYVRDFMEVEGKYYKDKNELKKIFMNIDGEQMKGVNL